MTPGLLLSLGTTLLTSYLGSDVEHLHDGARRAGRVGAAVRVPRDADGLQPLRREGGRGGARPRRERAAHVPRGHAADRLGRRLRRRAVRVHAGLERVRAHVPRHRPGRDAADGALHRDDGDRLPALHLRARRAHDAVLVRADRALPARQRRSRSAARARRRSRTTAPRTSRWRRQRAAHAPTPSGPTQLRARRERRGRRAPARRRRTCGPCRRAPSGAACAPGRTRPRPARPRGSRATCRRRRSRGRSPRSSSRRRSRCRRRARCRRSCRSVPKNAEGCCFSNTTIAAGRARRAGSISQPSEPRTQAASPGHLTPNGPASERSGSYAQYE